MTSTDRVCSNAGSNPTFANPERNGVDIATDVGSGRKEPVASRSGSLPPWLRGVVGSTGVIVLARGIGLVNAALLAHLLHPAGYGLYSYAYAIAALLAIPAQFGIPTVVTREVATAESLSQWGLGRGVIHWAHSCIAAFSLVILAIAAGVLLSIAGDLSTGELLTYAVAIILIPVLSLDSLRGATLIGLRHVVLGQLPSNLLRPLLMLVVLLVAFLAVPTLVADPLNAMLLLVVAAIIAYLIGGAILLRVRPHELAHAKPSYAARQWSQSALPIGLNSGLQLVNQYASIVLLGIFATKAEVGQYQIAVLGASMIVMALQAVNATLSPYFARAIARDDRPALQRFMTRSAQVALLVAVPSVIIYAVFGRQLLDLFFGMAYRDAWLPLVILAVGQLVNAAVGSVGTLLYMSNHERDVVVGVGIGTVSNVVLNLALIPLFGMKGAAIATATSMAIWNLVLCGRVWRRLHVMTGPIKFRTAGKIA